jgi:hypothetical protein
MNLILLRALADDKSEKKFYPALRVSGKYKKLTQLKLL